MKKISQYFIYLACICFGFPKTGLSQENRNYFLELWKPKTFITPNATQKIVLEEGAVNNKITLYLFDTLAPVLQTISGLNTTFRSGSDMVNKRLDNYRNSNMGAFRFPAGSGSNKYFWDGNPPASFLINLEPIDATENSALKIKEFVAFIDSLDAEATIVVNYFYARYGITAEGTRESKVNQAAEYAAGFVNYVNNVLKAGIKNWEVGNECYGKWEEGYDVNGSIVTGKEYGEDFRIFAEKMKAIDPSIKVGAVMWPKDDNWNNQVMKEVKDHADFLVVHNYFTPESEATIQNILSSTTQVNEIKAQMESCVVNNTSFPAGYFPVAMTEYNCRGPHTTTFINACFTADVLGRLIENGYGLATRWVGEWKWKVGTHGIFALDDPEQKDYSVRQAYMIYHYLGKSFGDVLVKSGTNMNEVSVYASKFSDGKTGLMVINPTSTLKRFHINFPESKQKGKAWIYEVYANSVDEGDKKFYVNGFTSTTTGGGPDDFTSIPALETQFNVESLFAVKKFSVSFMVFELSDVALSFNQIEKSSKPIVYPNPTRNKIHLRNLPGNSRVKLFNDLGQLIFMNKNSTCIDVSGLKNGVYYLNYTNGLQLETERVIIENN